MLGASGAFPCLEFQIQSQTDNMISYFIKVANYKVKALTFLISNRKQYLEIGIGSYSDIAKKMNFKLLNCIIS